jgi:HAMP domain-containing protein
MTFLFQRFFSYCPSKPRHPLLRLLVGILGLAVLVLLVAFGLVIGLGMLLFAAVRRLMRPTAAPARAQEGVIEGEFVHVHKTPGRLGLR